MLWLRLLIAAVAVVVAVPASARADSPLFDTSLMGGGGAGGAMFGTGAPGDSPAARERAQHEHERMSAEQQERKKFLASPEAEQEQKASRTATDDLSDRAAIEVLKDEFASELKPLSPDTETLLGGRRAEYLDDFTARVIGQDGKPEGLIDSQAPLRTPKKDKPAQKEATDLDLVASGDGSFVPDAAPVPLELPGDAKEGVAVGKVSVVPEGAAQAERVDGDTIAYPNIDKDTDLVVNPTANGMETFDQLRSPDAPEAQQFDFKLPPGAHLRKTEQGAVQVLDAGKVKLTVSPPVATDAQGQDVPSALSVEGDSMTITTRHRDRSVAYPVLVDPLYTATDDWACAYRGYPLCSDTWFHGYGWSQVSPPASQGPVLDGLGAWSGSANFNNLGVSYRCNGWMGNCFGPNNGGGPNWNMLSDGNSVGNTGLHVLSMPNTNYPANAYAQFVYDPPGTTTKISRADFGAKFLRRGANPGWMVGFTGIWSATTRNWTPNGIAYLTGSEDGSNDTSLTHHWNALFGSGGASNQVAAFGLTSLAATTPTNVINTYMGAAIMKLEDPEPPAPLQNTTPTGVTGWAKASDTYTFAPSATDPGLGVRALELKMPPGSTAPDQSRNGYCQGGVNAPCATNGFTLKPGTPRNAYDLYPTSWGTITAPPFEVPAAQLPEGSSNITLRAQDVMGGPGHQTDATIPVKLDRTPPRVTALSGRVREGAALPSGVFDLTIDAVDTGAGGAENSGVKAFEYKVDGGSWTTAVATCTSGPCSYTFSVDTREGSGLSEGRHEVVIRVTDGVAQYGEKTAPFIVDRTAPKLEVGGELKESPPARMTAGLWSLTADAEEVVAGAEPSGVATIKITVDGQPYHSEGRDESVAEQDCEADDRSCPIEQEIAYDPKEYPEGTREVRIVATDYAGNPTEETVAVESHQDPKPSCTGAPLYVYNLGTAMEGNSMLEASRTCSKVDPSFPEMGHDDNISYVYGDCPVPEDSSEEGETGCLPPLQVVITPLCLKHVKLYRDPDGDELPYEPLTIHGVPAAVLQDGTTLEIYTGTTTITIFGIDAAQVRRAAEQLRPALTRDIPTGSQIFDQLSAASDAVAPVTSLPQPDPQALNSTEPCQ